MRPVPICSLDISLTSFGILLPAKTDCLLEFLRDYVADYVFLVGGIFDLWAIRRSAGMDRMQIPWCRKFCAGRDAATVSSSFRAIVRLCRDYLGLAFGGVISLANTCMEKALLMGVASCFCTGRNSIDYPPPPLGSPSAGDVMHDFFFVGSTRSPFAGASPLPA